MEHIARKIDQLTEMMERQSHIGGEPKLIAEPTAKAPIDTYPVAEKKEIVTHSARNVSFAEQGEIDTSLFAQAIVATKFLEDIVRADQDPRSRSVAHEMSSVLETLQAVVESQRRRKEVHDTSPPFSRPLPPGTSTSDLPLPPIAKVMACLRMAQGACQLMTLLSSLHLPANC